MTTEKAAERLFSKAEKARKTADTSILSRSPLTQSPDWSNPSRIEILADVTTELISQHDGLLPSGGIHIDIANDRWGNKDPRPCVTATFQVDKLTPEQMDALEQVTTAIYRGKRIQGRDVKPSTYAPLEQIGGDTKQQGNMVHDKKWIGWNIGPDASQNNGQNMGIFAHRYIGSLGASSVSPLTNWFFRPRLTNAGGETIRIPKNQSAYQVELRMAEDLSQTDMVEYLLQVSSILSEHGIIQDDRLPFRAYSALLKRGLREVSPAQVRGLGAEADEIERTLFKPLLNSEVSDTLDLAAHSVLMIGVPGTGKTLLANMLAQKYGQDVFIVPMTPKAFADELTLPSYKRTILPRLAAIYQRTGVPVVLQMDDIEYLASPEMKHIASELQNMLEGLGNRGILLLASTNDPEKFQGALDEPGRLGHMVPVGLPNADARREILDVHMPPETIETQSGSVRFFPPGLRDALLDELASDEFTGRVSRKKDTGSGFMGGNAAEPDKGAFTSRFLVEICREAKARYVQRVTSERNTRRDLTLEQLIGAPFLSEDWTGAYETVRVKFGRKIDEHIVRNDAMEAMVKSQERQVGFTSPTAETAAAADLRRRIAARMQAPSS